MAGVMMISISVKRFDAILLVATGELSFSGRVWRGNAPRPITSWNRDWIVIGFDIARSWLDLLLHEAIAFICPSIDV